MMLVLVFACILTNSVVTGMSSSGSDVPLPSDDVLKWTRMEVGAMITFNMATFVTNCTKNGLCALVGGCTGWLPPVDTFNPTELDTDQWVETLASYGAKYAVLVAQHCSGFSMFPTNAYILKETGFNYTYSVDFTKWGEGKRDVMAEFVTSCHKRGIRPSVYYSLNHNYYLNVGNGKVLGGKLLPGQVAISQEQYDAVALAQYTQLLSLYGDMATVWFDGGMDAVPGFARMVRKYQPHAVYMNGVSSTNNVRWVGTESGKPPYPIWSGNAVLGASGAGSPPEETKYFDPAETDTTFYSIDHWFWSPDPVFQMRTLDDLKDIYHKSVGQNSLLLMNLAPDDRGLMPSDQVTRYRQAGLWMQQCYGASNIVAETSGLGLSFALPKLNQTSDRIVLQEDQSRGQRITTYSLHVSGVEVGSGTSVGNKRIHLLAHPVPAGAVVTVELTAVGLPSFRAAAYGPCP